MDRVFQGLPFVYTYIDDVLIASKSAEEHKQHLTMVFRCLSEYGIIINPQKCTLGVTQLHFLGHCVNVQGDLSIARESTSCAGFSTARYTASIA